MAFYMAEAPEDQRTLPDVRAALRETNLGVLLNRMKDYHRFGGLAQTAAAQMLNSRSEFLRL